MHSPSTVESRQLHKQPDAVWKAALNGLQDETLRTLEQFGWGIRFVRSLPAGQMLAVVFDPDRQAYAVIEPNGNLVKNPAMRFR